MDSLRKSFKSHGSYKHIRRLSGDRTNPNNTEELPILSSHHHDHHHHQSEHDSFIYPHSSPSSLSPPILRPHSSNDTNNNNNNEVIVKVDNSATSSDDSITSDKNIGREASFGFVQHENDDPPSKLIGQFLHVQRTNGVEVSLDMDLEMDELKQPVTSPLQDHSGSNTNNNNVLPPTPESPRSKRSSREIRVSFEPSVSSGIDSTADSVRRRYKDSQEVLSQQQQRKDQVLRCTSNASFRRQASLLSRIKTRSRLIDPSPEEIERMSGKIPKSGQIKSGLIGRNNDEDEDDLLDFDDIPEEFNKGKVNIWVVLEWVSLILIIAALICTLCVNRLRRQKIATIRLWRWELMLLVLICGRLVSGWVIRIVVFFIERNFFMRRKVLYFVYGLRKGVQNCLWLGLVLLAWHYLFDNEVGSDTRSKFLMYLSKILICFLVANFIWLVKTLAVKVLASSFHVSTYFDRIQESVFNQYVIETLSGPPVIEIEKVEEEAERTASEISRLQNAGATMPPELKSSVLPPRKSFKAISTRKSVKYSRQMSKKGEKKSSDEGIPIDHLHKLNPKNISAWNMKRLMNIVRHGTLSTLDEQILGDTEMMNEDESATKILSEHEAKLAARKIFCNVARPGSKYIYLEDLMRFMPDDEALKTMSFFEGASETSKISKKSLKNWVVNAFRERKALSLTLNDTKTAVKQLHHMVNVIVGVIVIILWLLILGVATSKFFMVLGSQIVVVSFIFGNTAKTLFESIIFLFFMHPFDVGDRCEVDGVQMIVEEMNILTTVFLRADNQKIVFPNSVLGTKPIGNYYRSPDMGDSVEFLIQISTPTEKLILMKQRIISYIENKKEHWYSNPLIIMKEVEGLNKLRMAVWIRHKINHQDMGEKWGRRSLLLEEMVKVFKELDIQYKLVPIDINVRAMPPTLSSS